MRMASDRRNLSRTYAGRTMPTGDHQPHRLHAERHAVLRAARGAMALLHRGWSAHPLVFTIAGIGASALWPALLRWIASLWPAAVPVQTSVQPVLARGEPADAIVKALLVAPLLENLLLLVLLYLLQTAASCAVARLGRLRFDAAAGPLAVAASSLLFAAAHAPFKPLYGAEVLVVAWLMCLSLLWGLRERRLARGFGLALALHEGVNMLAVARFFGW